MTENDLSSPLETPPTVTAQTSISQVGRATLQASLLRSPLASPLLLGFCLGAGAAWLLSDGQRRTRLLRGGLKLYDGLLGGLEELKEEVADLRAELDAERHGGA